ncbi:MAG: extracellular solute-binding protein [Chloroflexi bacterium]|nr:extracellular solute-binding protein [Chloroflexota bacterium]
MPDVTRRRYVRGTAAAAAGLLAACGPFRTGGEPAPRKDPVTLRVNYRTEQWIVDRAKAFTATNPHITLDLIANSGYEKLLILAAAGDLGDVYWASTGQGSYFELASQGFALDLEPLAKRDKFDLKQFYPHALNQGRLDGKLYGLPEGIHPGGVGLYYNVTLFEQAGLKPPTLDTSFDELTAAARQLTARPDQWGIVYGTVYWQLTPTLRSFGAEWMDPPSFGKKAVMDSPKAMQAWQWYWNLTHKHRAAPIKGVDKAPSFTDGNVALWYAQISNSSATLPRQIGGRFKVDATLIPKGPGGKRGSHAHVNEWSISARTTHVEEAWLVQKWYANKDSAMARGEDTNSPGSRPDAWNDPHFTSRPMHNVFKKVVDEGPGPMAIPDNFKMLEMEQLTNKVMEPLWTGQQAPQQLIAAIKGEYQQLLDRPRPGK